MEIKDPVYRFGRIYNKHLILEIFAFVGYKSDAYPLIYGSNR